MRLAMLSFLASAATLSAACTSYTQLPEPVRASVAAQHQGRTVELRQSCYYGDLYDENEKYLLSPHPFSETYHIVDMDGEPIHPSGQRDIVPAGTRFVIDRIEFPDSKAMPKRMLTTPRYNPWIYLKPLSEELPRDRKHFILLLPMDMQSADQVEQEIARLLAPEGEAQAWLQTRKPSIAVAIRHKDIVAGMNEAELIAAMGLPHHWFKEDREGKRATIAWYPSKEAWFVDGNIVAIEPPRHVDLDELEAKSKEAEAKE